MDKKTYDMIQDIFKDSVWNAQKKIEEELGISTNIDIKWKAAGTNIGSIKGQSIKIN